MRKKILSTITLVIILASSIITFAEDTHQDDVPRVYYVNIVDENVER